MCALLFGASCQITRLDPISGPDFVPLPEEVDLWAASARYHEWVDESGSEVLDAELQGYLDGRLREMLAAMGATGAKARIRVIRDPYLRAHVTPDGVIYLCTGMLVRLDNEAQLAVLLGHELAHFLQRHAIEEQRSWRRYSRAHEAEADRLGFEGMIRAGYDPAESVTFFELLKEGLLEEGANLEDPILHTTHPHISERLARSRQRTSTEVGTPDPSPAVGSRVGSATYQAAVRGLILENASLDLSVGRTASAERGIERLLRFEPESAEAWALLGRVHAERRGDPTRVDAAIHAFERAASLDPDSAALQRELGLLYHSEGRSESARSVLQRYLELAPDAVDRPIVEALLAESAS